VRKDPKLKLGLALALAGLVLSALLVLAEFLHVSAPTPSILGVTVGGVPWAERAFLVLFGAIHLVVAAIITVFRRTAT
jgi:hypothetical protein